MKVEKRKALGLLGASALCTALGGLQSVMVTSWLQPFLLLQFLHVVQVSDQKWGKWIGLFLLTVVVQSLGFTIAFAGMFNDPVFTDTGVITVFFISLIAWLILSLPFFASTIYRRRYGGATMSQPLVFAFVWTALWHLEGAIAPIGSVGNPAYAQVSFLPLVLTASIWGTDGIVFLMAWAASVAHESQVLADSVGGLHTSNYVEGCTLGEKSSLAPECQLTGEFPDSSPGAYDLKETGGKSRVSSRGSTRVGKSLKQEARIARNQHAQHTKVCGWVFFLALLYTGCRVALFSGGFFERGIAETLNPTVGASCILRQGADQVEVESLWNETQQRVDAGDAFVIWSEAATFVQGDDAEAALLARAAHIATEGSRARQSRRGSDGLAANKYALSGPYLGISYIKFFSPWAPLGAAHNIFSFILPDGSVGFEFLKAHPVPFVETNLVAGPGEVKVVDTELGRIGGAICFDFEFPELIRQAGKMGVDIMVQPSWTWGPVGPLEFDTDAFRAVENGFTMLRCSSVGVSGVVTPFYRVLEYREALTNSVLSMELPIMKKVWTFYPIAGFLFGRLALAIALLYAMLTWLPLSWVHRFLAVLPDRCCRFLVSRTIWQLQNEKDDENSSQEYDKRLEHNMSGPLLQTSFGNVNSSSDIHSHALAVFSYSFQPVQISKETAFGEETASAGINIFGLLYQLMLRADYFYELKGLTPETFRNFRISLKSGVPGPSLRFSTPREFNETS